MRFALSVAALLSFCLTSFSQQEEDIPLEQMNGKQIYAAFCSRCHGEDGRGDIPQEMLDNMEVEPPDLTEGYFSSREKRKDWQAVVAHGGGVRGLSMAMPAWGEALSERQIAETVDYMKAFVDQRLYPQGELNFFRGHATTKAFVEQEALLIPTHQYKEEKGVTESETGILFYYANRFGNRFQYEVKLPFVTRRAGGARTSGIGDLELGVKYAFYDNYQTLTILTAGVEAAVPTGSEAKGFGAGSVVAVPYIAAGQGVGDLLQLSSSIKLEAPLDNARDAELRASLLSLLTLSDSKQGVFPGLEFFAVKNLGNAGHTVSLIPQLYWGITARGHLALSVGAEFPVAGDRPYDGKIRAFFLWDFVDGGLWW